ncbi:hypothetical protein HUO13_07285 [Saccharopolyspora erythraea]|uniref:hypothetical protein n=1 Tax=Saccharopolyspora erythraea TaxID=1836 RepID=UPI001BADDC5F|nr:hypothetical protein [Saccharopolyspora erythraea]QUH00645.1 hypothetical protein HUO13_07285 [Saccharopolyspora erythraea]
MAAAEDAGRRAARELAGSRDARDLAAAGEVELRVGPSESPIAAWLLRTGRACPGDSGSEVLVDFAVEAEELGPVSSAEQKARSPLVREAYARAYCAVLAEEAGAVAETRLVPGGGDRQPPVRATAG